MHVLYFGMDNKTSSFITKKTRFMLQYLHISSMKLPMKIINFTKLASNMYFDR
jgi:hypothetical protein